MQGERNGGGSEGMGCLLSSPLVAAFCWLSLFLFQTLELCAHPVTAGIYPLLKEKKEKKGACMCECDDSLWMWKFDT